jgi:DNA polymerase-4
MCQDTLTMVEAFHKLWRRRPRHPRPTQVAVTLYDLVPDSSVSLALFPDQRRRLTLSQTMDRLNDKFGANAVYFGGIHAVRNAAPTRIAFTQIPDLAED